MTLLDPWQESLTNYGKSHDHPWPDTVSACAALRRRGISSVTIPYHGPIEQDLVDRGRKCQLAATRWNYLLLSQLSATGGLSPFLSGRLDSPVNES